MLSRPSGVAEVEGFGFFALGEGVVFAFFVVFGGVLGRTFLLTLFLIFDFVFVLAGDFLAVDTDIHKQYSRPLKDSLKPEQKLLTPGEHEVILLLGQFQPFKNYSRSIGSSGELCEKARIAGRRRGQALSEPR